MVSASNWLIVALAATAMVGCASTATQAPDAAAAPQANAASYIIGPGDSLDIFVWRNPELSVTVPVRPDGRISSPLVEDMVAAGKTATQLARDIEGVLAEYVREPNVTVIVGEFVGQFTEQIRVVGQATEPRSLPYREEQEAEDARLLYVAMTRATEALFLTASRKSLFVQKWLAWESAA